jgi:phenylacetate-coenzyme A ligase PaaK-like adenylate-forming protein
MRTPTKLERFRELGRGLRIQRAAAANERLPREELIALRDRALGELVAHASRHSPLYRERLGGEVAPHEVRLEQLPVVTKADLMDRFDDLVTDPALRLADLERHVEALRGDELYLGRYRVMTSSGSSGRRAIYVYGIEEWREVIASALRWTAWAELTPSLPRRRVASVSATGPRHMTWRGSASMDAGVHRTLRLRVDQPLDELIAALNAFQPHFLTSYPSLAAQLAAAQLEGRLRISPQSVSTSSEQRTDAMTALIRQAWGVEPFNCLGMTETGITAVDCATHQGMHVFEDRTIIEVVDADGRPVPPGTPGHRVLATNLYLRTQPLIRFEITDLMTVTEDPCPCGCTFARITALEGRTSDIVELPGGAGRTTQVHPARLTQPLVGVAGLAEFQIVVGPGEMRLRLAPARGAEPARVCSDATDVLGRGLRALGVEDVALSAELVDHIERDPVSGKVKLLQLVS